MWRPGAGVFWPGMAETERGGPPMTMKIYLVEDDAVIETVAE